MIRALLALFLVLVHLPVDAAPRRRAVQHPSPAVAPAAAVTAARQAAQAALKAGAPAVQIALSHRGTIIYAEAFGMSDRESGTAATPRSVMQIASVSKQFTAAAVLRLAERGSLSLDDRIEKFVPEFNNRGATITLRHLLHQTSGVGVPSLDAFSQHTRAQFIAAVNAKPFEFAPGAKWAYNNANYTLAGFAIESISGLSYAEFVHQEFALPLGLLDTGVCGTHSLPLLEGYGLVQGSSVRLPAVNRSAVFAAGDLCSTASDLARWSHLLAKGPVLLPASYAVMTTAVQPPGITIGPYGLGLFVANQLGRPTVFHGGAIAGFQSSLVNFSNDEMVVAVIVNMFPAPFGVDANVIALTVANAALTAQ